MPRFSLLQPEWLAAMSITAGTVQNHWQTHIASMERLATPRKQCNRAQVPACLLGTTNVMSRQRRVVNSAKLHGRSLAYFFSFFVYILLLKIGVKEAIPFYAARENLGLFLQEDILESSYTRFNSTAWRQRCTHSGRS